MVPQAGEHADLLRALGRFLDQQQAGNVEIVNHEVFLTVSWEKQAGGAQQRAFQDIDVETLRAQAIALRKGNVRNPGGSLAEMLRTLGQELDRDQAEVSTITSNRDSFTVSGVAGNRYFRKV